MPSASLSALVFFIRDPERTAAYYRDVLGLDVTEMPTDDGLLLTAETGDGGPSLVFLPADEPAGRSPVVVFSVDEPIEEAVEALVRHNVEIVSPVSHAPDGGLTADFLDPDGHVLSYYQPPA